MTLAARIVPALAAACLALHLSVACVPNNAVRLPNTSSWSSTGNARNNFTQDYFYLLTYEYHGQWADKTGHSAPLHSSDQSNVNFTVSEMISMVPASKLVVGIFLYGLEFNLKYENTVVIGTPASWKRELTYREVCDLLCSEGTNWRLGRDSLRKVPYISNRKRWIAYENEDSIEHKIDFIEALNLRGVFVWTLDADAFSGCCGATYPLLTPIHNRMKVATDKLNAEEIALGSIVTCFLDYGSVYRPPPGYFTIEDIDTRLCTHVIYCYAGLDETNHVIVDLERNYAKNAYERLLQLKKKNPALVVTVSVGGASEETKYYSKMAADHEKRRKFIASVVDFVRGHRLDGIDLAWDSPATPEDKDNFVMLCQEIRNAFRRMNWLFTVSVSGNGTILDQGYNLTAIANEIDLLHLLAFNYNSPSVTGHPSPLKPLAWKEGVMNDSVQYSLLYALVRSVPAKKIVLVTNFISSIYKLTNASNHGLGAPSHEPGSEEIFTYTQGIILFNELCLIKGGEDGRLWELVLDPDRGLPYMYKDDLWIAYDNVTSIREKALLAKSWKLAGVGAWTVSTDDFRGRCGMGKFPLLTEINKVLGRVKQPPTMAPTGIDQPGVPGTWCSLVEQVNVSVAVLQCGSSTQQNCIVNGEVPSQTFVFANCWNTTMLAMECRPDGFWVSVGDVPDQQEDKSATNGDRMKFLCQPHQLNSLTSPGPGPGTPTTPALSQTSSGRERTRPLPDA